MFLFWKSHPIYDVLELGDKLNDLKAEYQRRPRTERFKLMRRAITRELMLLLCGQNLLRANRLPESTRKILWYYDWTTLGDSIMDLSQRFAFPPHLVVDLCIPKGPAELFVGDSRFSGVYRTVEACPRDYDFILLHSISSASIRVKLRHFFQVPFATMIEHQQGELFARIDFSAIRLGRLLDTNIEPQYPPAIANRHNSGDQITPGRTVVVIGSKDPRRGYNQWPALLQGIVDAWDTAWPKPTFTLIGNGPNARRDLANFAPDFLSTYCETFVDATTLIDVQQIINRGELFLAADGGLMHIAEALQKPGVCLFSKIPPEWRLPPSSRLHTLFTSGMMDSIPTNDIVTTFLAVARLCR